MFITDSDESYNTLKWNPFCIKDYFLFYREMTDAMMMTMMMIGNVQFFVDYITDMLQCIFILSLTPIMF